MKMLTTQDGLSENSVTSIVKDQFGFMWFGTRGGLNRYDGYTFTHFKPRKNSSNSLPSPSIESLCTDKKNNIWIGSKTGELCMFESETTSIKRLSDSLQRLNRRVISIKEDSKGNIWLGTWRNGVYRLNPNNFEVKHYLGYKKVSAIEEDPSGRIWFAAMGLAFLNDKDKVERIPQTFQYGQITDMALDEKRNCFWIGGWKIGLVKFNYLSKKVEFDSRSYISENETQWPKTSYKILNDGEHIWIGTWGKGLFKFSIENNNIEKIDLPSKSSIILYLFKDNNNDIWVGLDDGGIALIQQHQFFMIINIPKLNTAPISCVLEDSKQRLWIGTKGHGLYVQENNRTTYVGALTGLSDDFDKLIIKTLYEDSNGDILVGLNSGLGKVSLKKGDNYIIEKLDLPVKKVTALLEQNKRLWVGTQQKGLFLFQKKSKGWQQLKHWKAKPNQRRKLQSERITKIFADNRQRIWISSYGGIHLFFPKDSNFTTNEDLIEKKEKLICDIVLDIMQTKKGGVWLATPCGMYKLHEIAENKFSLSSYTTQNGLADDYIQSIQQDNAGRIWAGTNQGLARLDTNKNRFRNFDKFDGLASSSFLARSSHRGLNGKMYFGGIEGLTAFSPEQILDNSCPPPIAITSLKVHNREVKVAQIRSGRVLLNKSINKQEELVLAYTENDFSIEFAALDFTAPERNLYAYKLDEWTNGWQYLGNRHYVAFNNLPPGSYVLHLRGSNKNSNWNEQGRSIKIKILPPIWRTWWAKLSYLLILLAIIYAIRRNAIKQERLAKKLELERMKGDKDREMSEMKLNFFTNISHEFRTPLTLIIAPLEELLKKNSSNLQQEEVEGKMKLIHYNAQRLLRLINQLIDFRKAESGAMKLKASPNDIVQFVQRTVKPFLEIAEINNVDFLITNKTESIKLWFDYDKLDMVLNNLLSNAFKYVGSKGKVEIRIWEDEKVVYIGIKDNGKGIPKGDLDRIFEHFYQVSPSPYGSSGIGLALTKRIVEMHHGKIGVESSVGKGTTFTVELPKGNTHLTQEQIGKVGAINAPIYSSTDQSLKLQTKKRRSAKASSQAKLLVVEDNADVRNYIGTLLNQHYEIELAEDGAQGWELAQQNLPDLIISDVMMPHMDGFELCTKVKSTERTSHIPVILLTAKTADQFRLFGVKTGADSYISKPFNPEYLIEKIAQILAQRKKWQSKFSKKIKLGPKEIEITPQDKKLATKALRIIEKHMDDPKFDANVFASEMGMSISTLNRKLKTISDQPPAKFIRSIRLQRAVQLLADQEKTISEIATETGFDQIRSFRNCFQAEFGVSPSEYRKTQYGGTS